MRFDGGAGDPYTALDRLGGGSERAGHMTGDAAIFGFLCCFFVAAFVGIWFYTSDGGRKLVRAQKSAALQRNSALLSRGNQGSLVGAEIIRIIGVRALKLSVHSVG